MIVALAKSGRSFKGLTQYLIHDIGASTGERVTMMHTLNLRTDDAEKAAKVMAWTAKHSEDLKRATGERTTGRKMETPVMHYSLNWRNDDKPTEKEMIEAAKSSLKALGLSEHEAVLVAHQDKEHHHVHLMVNKVHPTKGTSPALSYSKRALQAWAYEYEKERGKIMCEERAAVYEKDPVQKKAAQAKQAEKPKENKKSKSRKQWEAEKEARNARNAEAQEIRQQYQARAAELMKQQEDMRIRQKSEQRGEEQAFKDNKKRLWNQRGAGISATLEDFKARSKPAWGEFFREERAREKEFHRNEKSFMGVLINAYRASMNVPIRDHDKIHKGRLAMVFSYIVMRESRVKAFEKEQQTRKAEMMERMGVKRKEAVNQVHQAYVARMTKERENHIQAVTAQSQRHAKEQASQREAWGKLNADRAQAWKKYARDHGLLQTGTKDFSRAADSAPRNSEGRGAAGRGSQGRGQSGRGTGQGRDLGLG